MHYDKYLDAAALRGKTITAIQQNGGDRISLSTSDGKTYEMFHSQDCCESVNIHDIQGDLSALIGSPLVEAHEESTSEWPDDVERPEYQDSYTWTIYRFETDTAKVRIRWLGESNGYYSESVQIAEMS